MNKDIDLILALTGRMPLSYAFREDGSLAVVIDTGQKFVYSKEQVDAARQPVLPMPNTPPKPKPTQPPPKKK